MNLVKILTAEFQKNQKYLFLLNNFYTYLKAIIGLKIIFIGN